VRTLWKLLLTLAAAAGGLVVSVVALAPAAHALFTAGTAGGPSDVLVLADLPERSQVFDDQGNLLTTFHAEQNREPVTFADVPPDVVNAILDTEDAKFWQHHGVNPEATFRALFSDTSAGGIKQGGSTITQQLVKNTLLTNERTVSRKIKEAVLAVRLENELTKQQILERYLNTVYFGNGAYGIRAAAETYFGIPVQQLTKVQGAFLAGLISNPDGVDPYRFAAKSKARRDFVLERMVANGHLTREGAAAARDTPIPTAKFSVTPTPDGQDGYFIEEVKQRLLNDPTLGDTPQARYNAVFRGGLRIYTTLDPRLEQDAKQAVANNLPDANGTWTSALVSVDTKTGAVRAIVGGPGFDRSQYRIATSGPGRQPGSSFKPIVLATALQQGYSIYGTVNGTTPCTFTNRGGPPYTAHNDEGGASGYMNLVTAMAQSVNCAYTRVGLTVGLSKVVSMAQQLGVTTPLHPFISMSLGSEEVRPIDMAGVYATFANDGVHHKPFLVDHIVDRSGKVIFQGGDKGTQVLSPDKAHEELVALRAVVTGGTGTAAALSDRAAAGKTGTAENNSNAWFDGVTPQLTTVVWMGSPIGNVPMTSVGGRTGSGAYLYSRTVFGGTYPAMIWHDFMSRALTGQASIDFPAPNPNNMGNIFTVPDPPGSFSPTTAPPTTAPAAPTTPSSTVPAGTPTTAPPTTAAGGAPPTTAPSKGIGGGGLPAGKPGGGGAGGGGPPTSG